MIRTGSSGLDGVYARYTKSFLNLFLLKNLINFILIYY